MDVINTLEGGSWKKVSVVESILYLFHIIPLVRKRVLALHPTSSGAEAAFFLE